MLILLWLVWWLIKGTPGIDATFSDSWFVSLIICAVVFVGFTIRKLAGRV